MKNTLQEFLQKNRRALLIGLTAILVGTLFLLAAGMQNLRFSPTRPFRLPDAFSQPPIRTNGDWRFTIAILIISGMLVLLFLILIVFILIKSSQLRKRIVAFILRMMLLLMVYALILSLLNQDLQKRDKMTEAIPESMVNATPMPSTPVPLLEPYDPNPTAWIVYLLTFGFILLAGGLGVWLWIRAHQPRSELQTIAQEAIDRINQGKQWEDVVIQCYGDMSSAAFMRKGIDRPRDMTPAEFSRRLEAAGIPAAPVRSLTRLFEQARYGSRSSNAQEAQEALSCLSQIVNAVDRKR